MVTFAQLQEGVIEGNAEIVLEITKNLLKSGVNPKDIIEKGLIPALDQVGEKFSSGEVFIPEMLVAAEAVKTAMDALKPYIGSRDDLKIRGKIVIGTAKGDLHDIGKNLVKIVLENGGFQVIDLGVNVEPKSFLNALKEENATLCGISSLLTTAMPNMENTVVLIKQSELAKKVKIMVGGAPISKTFADKIGADGYGENAGAALKLAKRLIE
jgi:5-methyltetrahydrofolate--homocysteine methyltransferase